MTIAIAEVAIIRPMRAIPRLSPASILPVNGFTKATKMRRVRTTAICAITLLSYLIPKFIVTVSKKAIKIYKAAGYNEKIFKFIPNGDFFRYMMI